MVVLEAGNTMMKQKTIKIFAFILALLPIILSALPVVSAYASGPGVGLMNLWDIFVEQMFGAFWPAVLFLAIIFFLILMLGGISLYTVIIFESYFILAMSIGYGYPLLVFPLLAGSLIYATWQIFKLFFENR